MTENTIIIYAMSSDRSVYKKIGVKTRIFQNKTRLYLKNYHVFKLKIIFNTSTIKHKHTKVSNNF